MQCWGDQGEEKREREELRPWALLVYLLGLFTLLGFAAWVYGN